MPTSIPINQDDSKLITVIKTLYNSLIEYKEPQSSRILSQEFLLLSPRDEQPEYYDVVSRPICLSDIRNRIENGRYSEIISCLDDMKLMFNNVKTYHQQQPDNSSQIYRDALTLESFLVKQCDRLVAKHGDWIIYSKESSNTSAKDQLELTYEIAREIVTGLEQIADYHLKNYSKFTLTTNIELERQVDSRFFELIGSLKNVSALGRKLLEFAPKLNTAKHQVSELRYDTKSIGSDCSSKSQFGNWLKRPDSSTSLKSQNDSIWSPNRQHEQDATSEDLLASLVESSSTDDFLVLSSSLDSITSKDMILLSLICIKAHDCFTLSHDIQGVAMLLRRVKFIILNILTPKNEMELIKKLLTSIGRYNEMNYVFDLFKERNQFEMLLSKGVEKTPELRIALFNYVKKNPEFYALVTLNFSMFCEIAESLEAKAIERLDKAFKGITLGFGKQKFASNPHGLVLDGGGQKHSAVNQNLHQQRPSDSSKATCMTGSKANCPANLEEHLNLSLVELVDATDCFAKAGRYKRSNCCEKKAKLIALQISLLKEEDEFVWLLHLRTEQLNDTILNFKVFKLAAIVAEAYDYHLAWSQSLFLNVILYSDFNYLREYVAKYSLSASLALELASLYRQYMATNRETLSKPTIESIGNAFKHLLSKLPDVENKCKMYTQCQFEDAKQQLMNQDPFVQAHLKDLNLV